MTMTIELILLLLVPTCWCAPQFPTDTCRESGCQVSDLSLDSALSTFLCFTKEEYGVMEELEKKLKLAEKIAPLLLSKDGSEVQVDKLLEMDSDRLVGLANLVLHTGDIEAQVAGRKTEEEHLSQVIDGLVQKTNFSSFLFEEATPHVLALLNCKIQNDTDSGRDGRGAFLNRVMDTLFGPPPTTAPTSTANQPSTAAPTSTANPPSSIAPTSTANQLSTVAPTSTIAPTSTAAPTSTIAPTSTANQPSTAAPTPTANPPSSTAPTSTIAPTSTAAPVPVTSAPIDISWSFGMTNQDIGCIVTGSKVNFIWLGCHNVEQLTSQSDYDNCKTSDTSCKSSPFTFPADTPGTFYFACGVSSGFHCNTGNMKAKITVANQC